MQEGVMDDATPDAVGSLAVGLGLGLSTLASAPEIWNLDHDLPAVTSLPVLTPIAARREFGPTHLNEQIKGSVPSDTSYENVQASPGCRNPQHNSHKKIAGTSKVVTPDMKVVAHELQENIARIGVTSPRSGVGRVHPQTVHGKTARCPNSPRSPALEHAMSVVSPILGRLPAVCGGSPVLAKASGLATREGGGSPYPNSTLFRTLF